MALLTASSIASRPCAFAARTLSCLPSSPIWRWRATVAFAINGSMPSSAKVTATCSISSARRMPWLAMRSRLYEITLSQSSVG